MKYSLKFFQLVSAIMAIVAMVLAVANCDISGVQTDCSDVSPLVWDGGGVGGSAVDGAPSKDGAGEGGALACFCPWPINFVPECAEIVFTVEGTCEQRPFPNFAACRSGVGLCFGGVCNAPNWPSQCEQAPAGPPWVACNDVGDCNDGNPCTSDSCPNPGCESCLHVPVQDLTDCTPPGGGPMLCRQGACCDQPAGFNPP